MVIVASHGEGYTFNGFYIGTTLLTDAYLQAITGTTRTFIVNTYDGENVLISTTIYIPKELLVSNLTIRASYSGEFHLFNMEGYGYVINYTDEGDVLKYYEPTNQVLKGSSKSLISDLIPGLYTDFNGIRIDYDTGELDGNNNPIYDTILITPADALAGTTYTLSTL